MATVMVAGAAWAFQTGHPVAGQILGWSLVGMLAVAMQIFAGHPQYLFYTAIAAGVYAALNLAVITLRLMSASEVARTDLIG